MKNFQNDVARAQKGDLSAFDNMVKHFRDMAVGYAYSILGDFQLAEDAAQEAFIQAYKDIRKLSVPKAFPTWFRRIILKCCDRNKRKKQLSTVSIETTNVIADPGSCPPEIMSKKETQDVVYFHYISIFQLGHY